MTKGRSALDAALGLFAALSWSFAVFAFGARLVSPLAGGLVAMAFLVWASAMVLSMHLRDRRLVALVKGTCPGCGFAIVPEHRHRSWEPGRNLWLAPSTNWDCGRCGYSQSEAWACPGCPLQ